MKTALLYALVLAFGVSLRALPAQAIKRCDEAVLLQTSKYAGRLKPAEISQFLYLLDSTCSTYTQFVEWSNELLFQLLDCQATLTLRMMEREAPGLDMATIFTHLSTPLNDVPLDRIIQNVREASVEESFKNIVLNRLSDGRPPD